MKRTWRFWVALWVGKITLSILRLLGKKGTTLPGKMALSLDPMLVRHLSRGYTQGIVIVTGTNGKTTTANLLAGILAKAGISVAFNQAGANLMTGIGGAMLKHARWNGSSREKMALLEVDEATVPKFCAQITPQLAIITNFFRDQLDRYGELDTTIALVKRSLPAETVLVLNADDPLVAQFGREHSTAVYYGIERTPQSRPVSHETREARFCPVCGGELHYDLYHYGQLGVYQCPVCNFKRPDPQILAQGVGVNQEKLVFSVQEGSLGPGRPSDSSGTLEPYEVALQGYYNLYNSLAALTAARYLGVETACIRESVAEFQAQAGRMEIFQLPEGPLTLTLVKNPTGFNQVIHTLLGTEDKLRLMIAINDQAADGRDISWLWDVDFEPLAAAGDQVEEIVCSGLRAEDMALRLKYAGVDEEKLLIEHSLDKGVSYLQKRRLPGERVFCLPTYTVLFPLRDVLKAYRSGDRPVKPDLDRRLEREA